MEEKGHGLKLLEIHTSVYSKLQNSTYQLDTSYYVKSN